MSHEQIRGRHYQLVTIKLTTKDRISAGTSESAVLIVDLAPSDIHGSVKIETTSADKVRHSIGPSGCEYDAGTDKATNRAEDGYSNGSPGECSSSGAFGVSFFSPESHGLCGTFSYSSTPRDLDTILKF